MSICPLSYFARLDAGANAKAQITSSIIAFLSNRLLIAWFDNDADATASQISRHRGKWEADTS